MDKFQDYIPNMDHNRKIQNNPSQCGPVLQQRGREYGISLHHEGASVPLQHMPSTHPSDFGNITTTKVFVVAFVKINSHQELLCSSMLNNS